MYKYLTLILFCSLFSINKDLIETTLLFHLNHTTNNLSIINSEDRIVMNNELNQFFINNNIYKIEKWIDFASDLIHIMEFNFPVFIEFILMIKQMTYIISKQNWNY